MKRSELTVEYLESKGYTALRFGDYTLADAVRLIKMGVPVRLEPRGNRMVAVITVSDDGHSFDKDVFSRVMTKKEREEHKEVMAAQAIKNSPKETEIPKSSAKIPR